MYTKKEEFTKKISDLKTEITTAVRQTMGQKADSTSGLKKAAHELLINLAQTETKINSTLAPILTQIEELKTEMGVKAMTKKLEDGKATVATILGADADAPVDIETLSVEDAKMKILKCETAQTTINEVKAFHQMLLPPGGKGVPKSQFVGPKIMNTDIIDTLNCFVSVLSTPIFASKYSFFFDI